MRDSKKITMVECDAPEKYKATVPLPDYLTDLIFQFGSFAQILERRLCRLLWHSRRAMPLKEAKHRDSPQGLVPLLRRKGMEALLD